MKQNSTRWMKPGILTVSLVLTLAAGSADAAVGFKAENGWEVSLDGFVNAFGVDEIGSRAPANVTADPLMSVDDQNAFRVRSGLLPGLLGLGVTAPKTGDLELKARVGLYPQINNGGTRTAFGSQLDVRELFFTVDGRFGQVLAGRALNLFQGKNILTDMTLFGVGVQGAVSSGGTTLGRIGYGYLYAQFGAQLRYTTPEISGAKLALAIVDPSRIAGSDVAASETRGPGVESELSYERKLADGKVQAWVSGLYQRATVPVGASAAAGEVKTAAGVSAGVGVQIAGVDLLASGFLGKGLGSFLLLDVDSLDASGRERRGRGFLAQAGYTLGSTKVGLSYGQNDMDETPGEASARQGGAPSALSSRKSVTGGVYHDLRKDLKLVAEYTHAMAGWFGGERQAVDVVAVGGFFLW